MVKAIDAACIKQEGLPFRQSPGKRKLKLKNVEYHKVFYSKLPLRRRFKRATGFKSNKAPQNVVSFDLTEDDDLEPPVKHYRDISNGSCLHGEYLENAIKPCINVN